MFRLTMTTINLKKIIAENDITLSAGPIIISDTTDSSSSITGSIKTAGGLGVAKKLYVGTDLSISGNVTAGTWNGSTITVAYGGTGATTLTSTGVLVGNGTSAVSAGTGITYTASTLTLPKITSNDATATTSSTTGAVLLSGGLAVSNATDATSATNGGTITTAGGAAIAKKLFVGTDLSVTGNVTAGTWNGTAIAVPFGGTGATTLTSTGVLVGNGTSAVSAGTGITYTASTLTLPKITSNDTTGTTSSTTGAVLLSGGLGIALTTDATSATNGGTITTAGGAAIAKKLFVGTDLSVTGNVTAGTWNGTAIAVPFGGTGATTLTSTGVLVGNGTSAVSAGTGITYTSSTLTLPKITSNDTTATTSSTTGAVLLSGGLGIALATDATSATNGGTFTTAGGAAIAKKLFVGGTGSFAGAVNMNSNKIINLATPTVSTDAATMGYVDSVVQGLQVKEAVHVATTGPQVLATDFEDGDTIDNHVINTGQRILIKNQSTASQNGIYTVNATGAPTRASDLPASSSAAGIFVFVEQGDTNGDTGWTCTNNTGSDVVGTDALTFAQFSGAGTYVAGTGLTLTGNSFSVNASQTQITAVGTIATGTWNGAAITVPFGGTGATSLTSTGVLVGNGTSAISVGSGITYASSTLTLPKITSNDTTGTTSSTTGAILLSGGLGIALTTDATSATNGGTITTAGGAAIAKKLFVGTDLSVSGNITSGTWNGSTISVAYGGTGATTLTSTGVLVGNGTSAVSAGTGITYTASTLTLPKITSNDTTGTTSSTSGAVLLSGGLGIALTTDATSSTNGGTITTAGGVAIAKKLFVGTDLSVTGNVTSGTWNGSTISVAYGGTGATTLTSTGVLVGNGTSAVSAGTGITYTASTLTLPKITSNDTTGTTSSTTGAVLLSGGLGIALTTDATSATNGGTITTAGGAAIAKKLFVGTDINVSGDIIFSTTDKKIAQNTADASDNRRFSICGGGDSLITRGAFIDIHGNEHTNTGQVSIVAGNVSGGSINLYTGNLVNRMSISDSGRVDINLSTASSSNSTGALVLAGGLGITNTSDATSVTVGGTITTAGGVAIAKKLFVGTDLSVAGNVTSGTWNGSTVTVAYGGTGATTFTTNGLLIGNGTSAVSALSSLTYTGSDTLNVPKIVSTNTTDATSASAGGTITTAGGAAIAKKLFVGTELSVGGNIAVAGATAANGNLQFPSTSVNRKIVLYEDANNDHQYLGFGVNGGLLRYQTSSSATDHVFYSAINSSSSLEVARILGTGGIVSTIVRGSSSPSGNLTIRSTSDATKGSVILDETTTSTSSSTGALRLSGGLGISNTTDATSATNGGSFTTAGGVAIAKKLFVGTDLAVGGNTTFTGTVNIPHSGLTGLTSGDDHTQYALLAGRSGGQTITGGTASGNLLTLRSTSNATKGRVHLDETTASTSSTTGALTVAGGLGVAGNIFCGGEFTGTILELAGGTLTYIDFKESTAVDYRGRIIYDNSLSSFSFHVNSGGTAPLSINTTAVTANLTTASTSSTTGALTVAGGLGVAGDIYSGGNLGVNGDTIIGTTTFETTSPSSVNIYRTNTNVLNAVSTSYYSPSLFISATSTNSGVGWNAGGAPTHYAGDLVLSAGDYNDTGNNGTGAIISNAGQVYIRGGRSYTGNNLGFNSTNTAGSIIFQTGVSGSSNTNTSYFTRMTISPSGNVNIPTATASTSSITGALTVTGGSGILGNSTFGGTLQVDLDLIANGNIRSAADNRSISIAGSLGLVKQAGFDDKLVASNGKSVILSTSDYADIRSSTISSGTVTDRLTISSSGVVNITSTTASTSTTTGALTLAGGLGVAGAIYGTTLKLSPSAGLSNYLDLNAGALASTTNLNTGITVWRGTDVFGMDFGHNTNYSVRMIYPNTDKFVVATHVAGTTPTAQSSFTERLTVSGSGVVNITSTTASTSSTTGALTVAGGIGVAGALNVGGGATITGGELDINHTSAVLTIRNGSGGGRTYFGNSGHGVGRGASIGTLTTGNDVSLWTAGVDGSIGLATQSTQRLIVDPNGVVSITATTVSTSTTTGALTVAGGIGVAGDSYYGATTRLIPANTAGQIQVCPTSNGTESSIAYFQNTAFGGVNWYMGHATGGVGSGNFGLWNSISGTSIGVSNTDSSVRLYSTTASISSTTGALRVDGGLGVAGDVFCGGEVAATGNVPSSNSGAATYIGLSANNACVELNSVNSSSTPFIDFTYASTDYRGRIIYSLSSEQFAIHTSAASRMTIDSTKVDVLQTTGSTSTTTGALTVAGGIGAGGNIVGATLTSVGNSGSGITSVFNQQGLHLEWNKTGGGGESWIINHPGGGTVNEIKFGMTNSSGTGMFDAGNISGGGLYIVGSRSDTFDPNLRVIGPGPIPLVDDPGSITVTIAGEFVNGAIKAVAYYGSSDVRLKDNIKDLRDDVDYSKFIDNVEPKTFRWKNQGNNFNCGYIAQDLVKKGFRRFVIATSDDTMEQETDEEGFVSPEGARMSINYSNIIPVLHQSIRDLKQENAELKQRLLAIEEKLALL